MKHFDATLNSSRGNCRRPSHHLNSVATPSAPQRPALIISSMAVSLLLLYGPDAPMSLAAQPQGDKFDFPSSLGSDKEPPQTSLSKLIQGDKGKEVEVCTRKCMPACIRGGEGAPGLGPISLRKELIVFKDGFRSRAYCLRDCAEVCALSIKGPTTPPPPP